MMHPPIRLTFGLSLCVAFTVTLAGQTIDRVLASVGGRLVTASDVRAARELGLVRSTGPAADDSAILEQLVDRLLVLDEVERYAPQEPREAEVRRRYDAIRQTFATSGEFERATRSTGMDEAALLQWLRNDLRIRAYLDQRFAAVIEPGPGDLEQYVRRVRSRPGHASLSDAEATRLARELARTERRDALITEWIQGLRRRASINYTSEDR
jgi:hypothetical protein